MIVDNLKDAVDGVGRITYSTRDDSVLFASLQIDIMGN